jgi:hypothetical protein
MGEKSYGWVVGMQWGIKRTNVVAGGWDRKERHRDLNTKLRKILNGGN